MTVTVLQAPVLDHDLMMAKRFGCTVNPNGKLERRVVWNLLNYLTSKGFKILSVFDDDEFKDATDPKAAMELIFDLDEARVGIEGEKGSDHGIVLIIGNGCDIISDWSYFEDDRDGFNAAMDQFNGEDYA